MENTVISNLETTVYHNALPRIDAEVYEEILVDAEISFKKKKVNRDSSSSEDKIDTSDEMIDFEVEKGELNQRFISDCNEEARHRKRSYPDDDREIIQEKTAREHADDLIHEAEASKARILTTPGMVPNDNFRGNVERRGYSSLVDNNYIVVGAHIDGNLRDRIKKGEYVDFARLLPRDKIANDEN